MDALDKAYGASSMLSTPLGESDLANYRMIEMLEKLKSIYGNNFKAKSFWKLDAVTAFYSMLSSN